MIPYLADPDVTLWSGDALDVLRSLPDESVHCIATSPPFFALRDYGTGRWEGGDPECDHAVRKDPRVESSTLGGGKATTGHQREGFRGSCPRCGAIRVDGQIGLEDTPDEWAARLVAVFGEARRVLRADGSLWIECGDSYCANDAGKGRPNDGHVPNAWQHRDVDIRTKGGAALTPVQHPTKPKDLLGQPFLLAFALRADGWYWRGCYPWHKPNAMPESAKDRCTTAHSYVLHFSKSSRYFFDGDAISEAFSPLTNSRGNGIGTKQALEDRGGTARAGRNNGSFGNATKGDLAPHLLRVPQVETLDGSDGEAQRGPDGRRATHVKQGKHSLQHRDGDRWPNDAKHPRSVWTIPTQGYPGAHFATWPEALARRIILAGCPEGGTVLDPFGGSGTTALVARKTGRRAVLIELNETYCALAADRLAQLSLLTEGAA